MYIDALNIATRGFLSDNLITRASFGYITYEPIATVTTNRIKRLVKMPRYLLKYPNINQTRYFQ